MWIKILLIIDKCAIQHKNKRYVVLTVLQYEVCVFKIITIIKHLSTDAHSYIPTYQLVFY